MYIHIFIYICVCVYVRVNPRTPTDAPAPLNRPMLGLYTILLIPIWYGVRHTKGRSRGGRILPNSRAIVLQQCGQCRRAGRMKRRLTRAETTRSKTISCKAKPVRVCSGGSAGPDLFITISSLCSHSHCRSPPKGRETLLRPRRPPIDSPCECEHNNLDSLDARLFSSVVLAVAPAVTMDAASSLSPHSIGLCMFAQAVRRALTFSSRCRAWEGSGGRIPCGGSSLMTRQSRWQRHWCAAQQD